MIKKLLFLTMLTVLSSTLLSNEVYFYRNGKKIILEEKEEKVYPAYRHGLLNYYINDRLFVKIPGTPSAKKAAEWCRKNGLELVKRYKYIPQWYLVSYTGNTIKKAAELVENKLVKQAEPSFFIPLEHRTMIPDDQFFFDQWHLHNFGSEKLTGTDHAHVANAWSVLKAYNGSLGEGIKLAIIDDGFDLTHEDLVGRFVNGKNFGDGGEEPLPGPQDAHGTACAGVAGASTDNGIGVAGACPECDIIPIRMNMGYGSTLDQIAIESFSWAAEQGAHIISNSWGPPDGGGAMDMGQPLKDLVLNLTTTGRNGKGIIILFAAGNGNESIETDGFASNPNVFAIGSTNASGNRSSYSDFGASLDFVAPSNDIDSTSGGDGWGGGSYIDGIWTTDNTEGGYNPGQLAGDPTGKYVGEFGGTSSSCPLAAGITGLVLAANPDLTRDQLYEVYKNTSDKVGDMPYDTNGFNTHYGFGRLNACEAVKKAIEMKGVNVSSVICGESDHNFDTDVPDSEIDDSEAEYTDNDQEKDDGSIGDDDTFEDDEVSLKKKDSGCSCSFLNI